MTEYLDYLHQNAIAWKTQQTSFKFAYKGGCSQGKKCLVQTVEYRVWCRKEVQRRFIDIQSRDKEAGLRIESLLQKHGCWDLLWKDGRVECIPELGVEPPFCSPRRGFTMVDSPKWPMEHLVWRYFKAKILPNVFIVMAFLLVAYLLLTTVLIVQ